MIVTLQNTVGDRTTLFGVSDFHAGFEQPIVTVFWPNEARTKYEIDQEEEFHNHRVVAAIDESACDLDTLFELVDGRETENGHLVEIVPTAKFPILYALIEELQDNRDFNAREYYVPEGTRIIKTGEHGESDDAR